MQVKLQTHYAPKFIFITCQLTDLSYNRKVSLYIRIDIDID